MTDIAAEQLLSSRLRLFCSVTLVSSFSHSVISILYLKHLDILAWKYSCGGTGEKSEFWDVAGRNKCTVAIIQCSAVQCTPGLEELIAL